MEAEAEVEAEVVRFHITGTNAGVQKSGRTNAGVQKSGRTNVGVQKSGRTYAGVQNQLIIFSAGFQSSSFNMWVLEIQVLVPKIFHFQ